MSGLSMTPRKIVKAVAKFTGTDNALTTGNGYKLHIYTDAKGAMYVDVYFDMNPTPFKTKYSRFETFSENWNNIRIESVR